MLALGADLDSADLHARAVLVLRERGIYRPSADEYVEAYETERRADEFVEPSLARPDPDELHAAATKLLKPKGIDKPDYNQYSDALMEVSNG
jgi:hypothetical protein